MKNKLPEIVTEVIVHLLYGEMYPPKENTAEELNNRKEKAIDHYLGRNLKFGELADVKFHYKVDLTVATISMAIRQEVIGGTND